VRRSTLGLAVICLGACGPSVAVDDGGTTGSSDDSDPTSATAMTSVGTTPDPSTTVPGTSAGTMTTSDEEESGVVDESSFVGGHDDVDTTITDCSIWERDCPPGLKCMPYANDGGVVWNATMCTPLVRDPRGLGEPCTAFEGPVGGVDDCDIHSMCWEVDVDTNEGTCIAFCIGSPDEPSCADETSHCQVSADGPLALCLPSCHPLDEPCMDGEVCVTTGDEFFCAVDAGGDGGAVLEPCEFLNVCDPGLFCATAELVPGCESPVGCCTPFCDLSDAMPCADGPPGSECVPWFEEGTAPSGYENLGACGVQP
jgi:hypothetical protein